MDSDNKIGCIEEDKTFIHAGGEARYQFRGYNCDGLLTYCQSADSPANLLVILEIEGVVDSTTLQSYIEWVNGNMELVVSFEDIQMIIDDLYGWGFNSLVDLETVHKNQY